ncbi:SDR family oxidoreductase [Paracoccus sp. 1_MG-2023]|uniref:SDR family oxidoreductase n=1 Tax=unclassified Paracoccus (in: a-proteobacteria) TaxID=2688777 RepID=UPI001C09A138|nr:MULTISPECIES: SDR family oxidoreductase [unclassified Paracoccus (in: a-proteobacteria)]MBU2956348.1 SDR family oxidoreductase [Paracoccus sp. C2R09]MDO6668024.1 SDR family oxidoreductase [Paracoccus sp. 1_MG-2023]
MDIAVKGVALVTGGAKRLGRAMALELARMGHPIAVHYAGSAEAAEATAARIRELGVAAETFQADLLDRDAAAGLVGRVAAAMGQLTVLVNNASIFDHDDMASASMEGWDRHMDSNLRAPFQLMQAFAAQAPKARADENGEPEAQAVVVNMVDQRVLKPTPEFMTYSIAKAGLWWLTRTAAQGLAPDVRVNAIGPGPTLQGARQSDAHFAGQRAATVLGRGSDPRGICDALRYLVSARGVTGQLICVDGGQHLGWKTPDVLGVE